MTRFSSAFNSPVSKEILLGKNPDLWFNGYMVRVLAVLMIFLISGCGFVPVYGTLGHDKEFGTEALLALVDIDNIPDRDGQFLRNELIDRFYRDGRPINPQYKLEVQGLKETLRDLDITEDSNATRGQLKMSAEIVLMDAKTRQVLMRRDLHAVSSYNILGSEFTNRVSEQSTRDNVLVSLAQRIETQVALYLRREVIE